MSWSVVDVAVKNTGRKSPTKTKTGYGSRAESSTMARMREVENLIPHVATLQDELVDGESRVFSALVSFLTAHRIQKMMRKWTNSHRAPTTSSCSTRRARGQRSATGHSSSSPRGVVRRSILCGPTTSWISTSMYLSRYTRRLPGMTGRVLLVSALPCPSFRC